VETAERLRMVYSFCPDTAMESIECRMVGDSKQSAYSGQFT
jgi:hypothetical protein